MNSRVVVNKETRTQLPEWMKQIGSKDLPEVYQEMADIIGVEATVHLARIYAGTSVYFPKLERALTALRNKMIMREYNGSNVKGLARRWGLSSRHVRYILNTPGRKMIPRGKFGCIERFHAMKTVCRAMGGLTF